METDSSESIAHALAERASDALGGASGEGARGCAIEAFFCDCEWEWVGRNLCDWVLETAIIQAIEGALCERESSQAAGRA